MKKTTARTVVDVIKLLLDLDPDTPDHMVCAVVSDASALLRRAIIEERDHSRVSSTGQD